MQRGLRTYREVRGDALVHSGSSSPRPPSRRGSVASGAPLLLRIPRSGSASGPLAEVAHEARSSRVSRSSGGGRAGLSRNQLALAAEPAGLRCERRSVASTYTAFWERQRPAGRGWRMKRGLRAYRAVLGGGGRAGLSRKLLALAAEPAALRCLTYTVLRGESCTPPRSSRLG